jgi:hypothetical protein
MEPSGPVHACNGIYLCFIASELSASRPGPIYPLEETFGARWDLDAGKMRNKYHPASDNRKSINVLLSCNFVDTQSVLRPVTRY